MTKVPRKLISVDKLQFGRTWQFLDGCLALQGTGAVSMGLAVDHGFGRVATEKAGAKLGVVLVLVKAALRVRSDACVEFARLRFHHIHPPSFFCGCCTFVHYKNVLNRV